jgi:hypothetical protein
VRTADEILGYDAHGNAPNTARIAGAIEAASQRPLSGANQLEASIVIESTKGKAGGRELVVNQRLDTLDPRTTADPQRPFASIDRNTGPYP